jgi:hypothetical protein
LLKLIHCEADFSDMKQGGPASHSIHRTEDESLWFVRRNALA